MRNYKKIFIGLGITLSFIASIAYASVFSSQQVGSGPVNGYYLQTNGSISTWAPVSGGGGGGSGGTWSTTTSSVPGHLNNYSNNNTDIVLVGGSSSSTAKFIFDPNSTFGYISGSLGIGTKLPNFNLEVNGTASTSKLTGAGLSTCNSGSFLQWASSLFGCATPSTASSTLLGDNNTFGGVDSFTNASSNFSGTWQTFSPSHFQNALTATWPQILTGSTLTFGGLGTSSNAIAGNIPYFSGVNTFANVGTSTLTPSSPLTGSFTQIGSGGSIGCQTASGSQAGCLSSTDWTTFNGKQASGNYITALTGDVTASGPGSVAATLATVNGNVGPFGGASSIPSFTVNGKGLITAASANTPSIPVGDITGVLPIANGGTASSTLGGIITGAGTSAVTSATIGSGISFSGNTLSNSGVTSIVAGTNVTISGSTGAVTINSSGGGGTGTGNVGTSSVGVKGNLAYWTTAGATPELLGNTSTSSIGAGTGLTFSGTAGNQVGGTNGTYSVNTTQNITTLSNLSTAGTVNNTSGGALYSTATSSFSVASPLTLTGTAGALIGGTNLTINCPTCVTSLAGAASSTLLGDNNTFIGKNVINTGTSTDWFSTVASSTNLFSASANFGTLTINGIAGATQCLQITSGVVSGTGTACGSGSGAVSSVSNVDNTLSISPTTGSVVASLNLNTPNVWTASTTFTKGLTAVTGTTTSATSTNLAVTGTVSLPNSSITNAELANSAVTINTSGPLGGGGSVSLGGNLTLTCTTCNTTNATVSSVGLSSPNSTLTLGGTNPVTTSGTINADLNLTTGNIWTAASTTFTGGVTIKNGTTTNATSTNFFTTTSSSTNLFTTNATITNLSVTGTATSTFGGGINLTTGCFAISSGCIGAPGTFATGTSLPVQYATVATLPSYTASGGVITEVGTGALSVDGNSPTVGQRILVKNESGACTSSAGTCQNGIYTVTAAGSGIAAFVITRALDYNSSANVYPGIATYVIGGATLSDDWWALTTAAPITVGTTGLTYVESSGGGASVASVSNSDGTLTISPTTGAVIGSLALSHGNVWTATTTFAGGLTATNATSTNATSTVFYAGVSTIATTETASKFNATSTIATSTFSGNILVGTASAGLQPVGGVANTPIPTQFQVTNNDPDLITNETLGNLSSSPFALGGLAFINSGTPPTGGATATNYAALAFSSPTFAAYPGLLPNSAALNVTDGQIDLAATSANEASSSINFASGPGFTSANYDVSIKDLSHTQFPGNAYQANLGIGSSTPFGRLTISASSTSAVPYILVSSTTNCIVGSTCANSQTLLDFSNNGNLGIASSSPTEKLTVNGGILGTENNQATSTSMTVNFSNTNQTLIQNGASNLTVTLTGLLAGQAERVVICNPASAAGTVTWATSPANELLWPGGPPPTQTTTANKCDVYTFTVTQATSTTSGGIEALGGYVQNF